MRLINTIRKKVWFCVNVAFVGFLVATGFALYSNYEQQIHLRHLRDLDFHLAMHSNALLNLFVIQKNYYKESFLFGSSDLADKGNALCEKITADIESITKIRRSLHSLPVDRVESLGELEKKYNEYVELATVLYPLLARGNDPNDYIEELQLLAAAQNEIHYHLEYFAGFYRRHFSNNVTTLMDRTNRNSAFLAVFFVLLLVIMSLVVNWAAEKTLITPLAHIKEAVRAFGRGQRSFPALEDMNARDDIGELGVAIRSMTKDLVNTTVSKAYVDSVLHNMNDSLIVTSNNFLICRVNRATLDLLGYNEDELIGQHIHKVLSTFLLGGVESAGSEDDKDLVPHLCSNTEKIFLTRDGDEIPVLLSTSRLKNGDHEAQGLVYVAKDITERKKAEKKLEQMALYDFLTGLPNRMTFSDRLEQALKQAHRKGHQAGLMFLDLDRFKEINDTMGHDCGDALLQSVAKWLSNCVRESDTVARIGGDEFAVILANLYEPEDAVNTAERILDAFVEPVRHEGREIFSSLSIGIALYPVDGRNTVDLLKNADMAMYRAKQNGGNSYSFFSGKISQTLPATATHCQN